MSDDLENILNQIGDKSPLVGSDLVPEDPDDLGEPESVDIKEAQLIEDMSGSNSGLADKYAENFQEALDLFKIVGNDVLKGIQSDRDQTQDVIDHLFGQIKNSTGKISPVWVESLVNAMRNKSDINQTAVKVMDSMIKFIAAGKGNEALANMNVNIDVAELTKLLQKQKYEDEV